MRLPIIITILAVLGAALLLVPACSDDHVVTSPVTGEPYPDAVTPDLLMENFATAYTERAIELYEVLLDEDFFFSLLPRDVAALGLKSDRWGREDELASARRMFSGRPHVRDDGTVVPAITAIEFLVFERATSWHEEPGLDRNGVLKATYDMRVRFARQEASELMVAGQGIFYAVPVADKRGAERYRLLGWVDQSQPGP